MPEELHVKPLVAGSIPARIARLGSSVVEQRNVSQKLVIGTNLKDQQMNLADLERAADLQKRAYALLLWTGREARRLLEYESLSSSAKCADWLKRHLNGFPVELRPEANEFDGFAKMLTSFFTTSFHLEGTGSNVRLVRGRKFKDGRNRKYAQGRAAEAAEELSRVAIASLAKEEGVRLEGDRPDGSR